MNGDPNPISSETAPPEPPNPSPANWRQWFRRLFICNPFFLCSAALLLLGINRLSTDDRLFVSDLHNLFFNFFSLQSYAVIVIGTALVLARRKVWYDSALLVVLDSGLALVPFMLISQASLEGNLLAWIFSASGGLMAALRCGAVRRWYPQFNLPSRLLGFGLLILMANVALPLIFRPTVEPDLWNWIRPNEVIWALAMPLLAAGANLLPRPLHSSPAAPARPWLPLLLYGLWTAGSGVHVWCLAHISSVPLHLHHFAPVACIAAWTFYYRLTDCVRLPSTKCRAAVLMLTALTPLLAFGRAEAFVLLAAINLPGYLMVSWKSETAGLRMLAKHLAIGMVALLFVAFPTEWREFIVPSLTPVRLLFVGTCVYLVVLSVLSRRLEMAAAGALGAGAICALLDAPSAHQPVQVALAFLVLHSLRWEDGSMSIAYYLRAAAVLGWVLESFFWTRPLAPFDRDATMTAFIVITTWALVWWATGRRTTCWIPGGALGALLASPIHRGILIGSTGVLAIIGSLLFFAAGAWVAWNRPRWTNSPVVANVNPPQSD